jgi:hypothetical protein
LPEESVQEKPAKSACGGKITLRKDRNHADAIARRKRSGKTG